MDTTLWEGFANQVNTNLYSNHTPSSTNTAESLKTTWHKIHNSLITATLKHISNKKFSVHNFQHTFFSKATHLHSSLKKLGNIIRQTKNALKHYTSIPIHLNNSILFLNQFLNLNIPILPQTHQLLTL